jgi:AcrR family transcriptional regulator
MTIRKRADNTGKLVTSREPLDREWIIQAALDLLNEVGLPQLTMRRLAKSLGIQAASLYWHVRNKAELMQMLADEVCARITLPDQNMPWQEQVLSMVNQYRSVLLSIRDSAEILADTPPSTPNRLRLIEAMFRIFTRAGFSPEEVYSAGGLINNYVLAFVMDEMRFARLAKDQGKSMEESFSEVRRMFKSLAVEECPTIVSLADKVVNMDLDKQFQFGLQVLLDGLTARLTAQM